MTQLKAGLIACLMVLCAMRVCVAEAFVTPWTHRDDTSETLHVSPSLGDDAGAGTADHPLRTIQRAIDVALLHSEAGRGTRIMLAPGTYRETIDIAGRKQDASLVIESAESGKAVVSGSDVIADWTPDPQRPGVFSAAWRHKMGWAPNPWPGLMDLNGPGLRRELLFIDGRPMRQVTDASKLVPGTYLIDEEAETLRLMPPVQAKLDAATVEASVRPIKRVGPHSKLLRAAGVQSLTIRGIVFEHAASNPFNDPAVMIRGCQNVLIEDCTVRLNNGVGLGFSAPDGEVTRNVRLNRVRANHNGTLGMEGTFHNGVIEHCETSFNNWRGAEWGATGWAPCGFKFAGIDGLVLSDHRAIENHASGAWFDDSNTNVLIERLWAINNFRSGISLEANTGRFVIRDSIFMGNSTGVNGFDTTNVTVENSVIAANTSRQIRISGSSPVTPEELKDVTPAWRRHRLSGQRPPENWTLRGNVIGVTGEQPKPRLIDFWMRGDWTDPDGRPYFDRLARSLVDENNTYAHPAAESGKVFPSADRTGATRDEWQALVKQTGATWSQDAVAAAIKKAAQQTGHQPTGFTGGNTEDRELGQ